MSISFPVTNREPQTRCVPIGHTNAEPSFYTFQKIFQVPKVQPDLGSATRPGSPRPSKSGSIPRPESKTISTQPAALRIAKDPHVFHFSIQSDQVHRRRHHAPRPVPRQVYVWTSGKSYNQTPPPTTHQRLLVVVHLIRTMSLDSSTIPSVAPPVQRLSHTLTTHNHRTAPAAHRRNSTRPTTKRRTSR